MSLHYLYLHVYFFIFSFLNKSGTPFEPICFFPLVRSWTICPLNLPLSSLTANSSSNPHLNVIVRPQQRPSSVVVMENVVWSFLGASISLGTSGTHSSFFVRALLTFFFFQETYWRTSFLLSLFKAVLPSRQLAPTCSDGPL